ncbi:MAG: sensor histidine kinase [Acutalibacter sp.]|jgi:two-component system sensor histidine kinase YesM|uniref:cache domain-containing sensor histidine kinase n=1 Tax=Acutalibacter sp. TaxID=1918636 RepID=UPI00216EFDC1|nr:histidine kinase [Acutalibacter sp.]MCI9225721.1 sensor histidine kinase [Acutalibacter sp.]
MNRIRRFTANIRLKPKFMIVFCSLLLVSVLTVLSTSMYVFHQYERELYRNTSQFLNMSIDSIESEFSAIDKTSSYVVTGDAVQEMLGDSMLDFNAREPVFPFSKAYRALNDLLLNHYGQLPYVLLAAVCVDGKSFGIGDAYKLEQGIIDELSAVVLESYGKPILHQTGGELFYVRNIMNMRGMSLRPIGVLVLQVDLEKIVADALKSRENLNYQPQIVIFSQEGERLFSSSPDAGQEYEYQPTENEYRILRIDEKDYFVSYATYSSFGLKYAMYLPFDTVASSLRLMNTLTLAVAVLIMLINTLFCSKLVSQIVQQFDLLVMKMQLFQAGRYEELDRYRSDSRRDELGYLNSSFDKMVRDVRRLVEENYLTKIAIQEAQLKSLQNQIDPHFLFNILQTISWKAKMGKQDEISQITEALGKILRYTLHKTEALVPLSEELEIVWRYISIQKYRYGDRLSVEICIPPKWHGVPIPPMALQNLVENSIKHALENMLEPCVIHIGAAEHDKCLQLFVEDNGPGIDSEVLQKLEEPGGGIGLNNIRRRLALLLGEQYTMKIYNTGHGTRVELLLPKSGGKKRPLAHRQR